MSTALPEGGFVWLTDDEIANLDILSIADDASERYILEVDLEYPCILDECQNHYPLAPERATVNIESDMLFLYCEQLAAKIFTGKLHQSPS